MKENYSLYYHSKIIICIFRENVFKKLNGRLLIFPRTISSIYRYILSELMNGFELVFEVMNDISAISYEA